MSEQRSASEESVRATVDVSFRRRVSFELSNTQNSAPSHIAQRIQEFVESFGDEVVAFHSVEWERRD